MIHWQAAPHRTNKSDCFADLEGPRGTVRYLIRNLGHNRMSCWIVRRNGAELKRCERLVDAKEFVQKHWDDYLAASSPNKLEGKAYAVRAIKVALMQIDKMESVHLDNARVFLEAAIDVLEGRVPRFAVLPQLED